MLIFPDQSRISCILLYLSLPPPVIAFSQVIGALVARAQIASANQAASTQLGEGGEECVLGAPTNPARPPVLPASLTRAGHRAHTGHLLPKLFPSFKE